VNIDHAVKVRIYPDKHQEELLARTFGCKRFLFNKMLEERDATYERLKHDTDALQAVTYTTEHQYKVAYPFLKSVDSIALQQARIDLQNAFTNFFEGRARHPRFKSRKSRQSYRTMHVNGNIAIDFASRRLKLPKLGWMRYRDGGRTFTERIRSVTVSRTKTGKCFASILLATDMEINPETTIHESKIAAFDMSATEFLVSEHERLENPRFYRASEHRLKRYHRHLSRKVEGSRNRDKARVRLARVYEQIAARRTDWLQKTSTRLANDNDAIIIEDLNMEGMKRFSGGLAKSVTLDVSWGEFTRMLGYKLAWRGKYLVKVDRFYPSSKLCSACGFKNDALTLDQRSWTCPACGEYHDREVNASANVKLEGMRNLQERGITIIMDDLPRGPREVTLREISQDPSSRGRRSMNEESTPFRTW
jgi:putative transposase